MSDYRRNIYDRLDSEHNARERGENATMMAIGAIADSLERIADSLEKIHSRLYEVGGLVEDRFPVKKI
jgi:hypothetical protein